MNNLGTIGVIVAARISSTRLPAKAIMPFLGIPMLTFLLRRIKSSKYSHKLILATSLLPEDDKLEEIAENEGVLVYRGDLEDVTARYVNAAAEFKIDTVVRITGDCPFLNAELIDYCLSRASQNYPFDLCTTKGRFPIGLDAEIYPSSIIKKIDSQGVLSSEDREHLTLYLYNHRSQYRIVGIEPLEQWKTKEKEHIFTVDEQSDYNRAQTILKFIGSSEFSIGDLISCSKAISRTSVKYSKSSSDIENESNEWLKNDHDILSTQKNKSIAKIQVIQRKNCILCNNNLTNVSSFFHRSVPYVECTICGHVQAEQIINDDVGCEFDNIYPDQTESKWISRRDRIYKPKLKWIIDVLADLGISEEHAKKMEWFEIGSGAGYFMDVLRHYGVMKMSGIEANRLLVERTNKLLKKNYTVCTTDIGRSITNSNAEIMVSFFVLEHLSDPIQLINAIKGKPKGTVFIFAVPVFGLSTVLEAVFDGHAARNLDSVVHRQLYTERSIQYFLDMAGYEMKGMWVFGQDASDFSRMLLIKTCEIYPATINKSIISKLNSLADNFQSVIDNSHFSDARHVLAVKK